MVQLLLIFTITEPNGVWSTCGWTTSAVPTGTVIPGGLANYLYFDVSTTNLNSTVILPAHIHSFPPAPLMPDHFIIINPLNAGDTARLNWTWEFKETGLPQNDAQNNTLQFNLSYILVNLTAPVVPNRFPQGDHHPIPERRIVIPQGPSIFDAGSIAALNPFQRPQLERADRGASGDRRPATRPS